MSAWLLLRKGATAVSSGGVTTKLSGKATKLVADLSGGVSFDGRALLTKAVVLDASGGRTVRFRSSAELALTPESEIIERDGNVTRVEVLRGVSRTIDAEAVRVVRKLKRWKPGVENKAPVKVRYRLPINFKLATN